MATFAWLLEGCGWSENILTEGPLGSIPPSVLESGQDEPVQPKQDHQAFRKEDLIAGARWLIVSP